MKKYFTRLWNDLLLDLFEFLGVFKEEEHAFCHQLLTLYITPAVPQKSNESLGDP